MMKRYAQHLLRLFLVTAIIFLSGASMFSRVWAATLPFGTFTYDGLSEAIVAYDGSDKSTIGYGPCAVLTTVREECGTTGDRVSLAQFAGFLAAKVTAGGPAFEGALYSPQKLQQLTGYLERRGVQIAETSGNPAFIARANGTGTMLLPRNPTVLQVKHELSHYIDFRNMGFDAYKGLGRSGREMSVLERLQANR
jgi:hypothetical protein